MKYLLDDYIGILKEELNKIDKAIENLTIRGAYEIEKIPLSSRYSTINIIIRDLKKIGLTKEREEFSYWNK